MADAILLKAGGAGGGSDDCTATTASVLEGHTAIVKGSDDEPIEGTMLNLVERSNITVSNTDQTHVVLGKDIQFSTNSDGIKRVMIGHETGGYLEPTGLIGVDSEKLGNANTDNVLSDTTFSSKDGVNIAGTMPNNGAKTAWLDCGESYTIPTGYHNGSGIVRATSLSAQTQANAVAGNILKDKTAWANGSKITGTIPSKGAATYYATTSDQSIGSGQYLSGVQTIKKLTQTNLTGANILKGKTISIHNGNTNVWSVAGTLAVSSAISFSAAALSATSIRIKWTNPTKGPWEGVVIRQSTSGYPGTGGGTQVYKGRGNSVTAGGSNYVDITGLIPETMYYFTCYSYATGLSNGNSYNVSAKTSGKLLYSYGNNPAGFSVSSGYPAFKSDHMQWGNDKLGGNGIAISSVQYDLTQYNYVCINIKLPNQPHYYDGVPTVSFMVNKSRGVGIGAEIPSGQNIIKRKILYDSYDVQFLRTKGTVKVSCNHTKSDDDSTTFDRIRCDIYQIWLE